MAELFRPGKPAGSPWFKSSYSNNAQGCVEVRLARPGVYMRDTKDDGVGPTLFFTDSGWRSFVDGVRDGAFGR
ncbi:DUF397 domain-containing protein [Salinispora arenicola]|uniref:DUF397 domain-containing protein n=1 Tax=Salinispora arenicola TaxID=168697 RepID=UPI0003686F67|nr:DUF397 domain-containing protein [Salinispora arenicola]